MSDNEEKIQDLEDKSLEGLVEDTEDRDEYERAMAALNKSKGERVKKIVEEKKAKKKKQKEAEANASSKAGGKPSFIDRCKKDPVIPACILFLVLACAFVVIKFVVPMFSVASLGVTVDEYRARYEATGIYNSTLLPYNFAIPEVTYQEGQTVSFTGAEAAANEKTDRLLYFYAPISNTATDFPTAIQGSVRKTDNEITALRVMAVFRSEYLNDSNYINFLVLYFGSYLQAFTPGVSDHDAQTLVYDAINQMTTGQFVTRQELAYRVSIVSQEGVNFIAFDIIPSSNLES